MNGQQFIMAGVMAVSFFAHTLVSHSQEAQDPWSRVRTEAQSAGMMEPPLDEFIAKCRAASISPTEGAAVLEPAFQACREGVPCTPIMDKIREGMAKGVPPPQLAEAARNRWRNMTQARELLAPALPRGRSTEDLVTATALALESGLPESVVKGVLKRTGSPPPNRLMHAMEAGEMLQLAGLEPQAIENLMVDFLERNLRRSEMVRAVRYSTQRHRRGWGASAARGSLWDTGAERSSGGPGRGARGGHGQDHATPSAGTGSGRPASQGSAQPGQTMTPGTGQPSPAGESGPAGGSGSGQQGNNPSSPQTGGSR